MNKKKFYLIVWSANALILAIIAFAYYANEQEKLAEKTLETPSYFADMKWPVGTLFEVSGEGDITLTSQEELQRFSGIWPVGTKFFLSGNELSKIEVSKKFRFSQIEFKTPAILKYRADRDYQEVFIKFKREIQIDGLDIASDCKIFFRNEVLNSAVCPNMDELFFKRKIELPTVSE